MKETGISTTVERGYNNLDGREEGRIIKAGVVESIRKEMKRLIEAAVTTRNLRPHHHCSRNSRGVMRCTRGANPFAQVTTKSRSQDMTQKD